MKPAAQIQTSIDLLDQLFETHRPVDRLIANYFRAHRYIGAKDKLAISEHIYDTLRQKSGLEYLLESQQLPTNARFLVAAKLHLKGEQLGAFYDGQGYGPKSFSDDVLASFKKINASNIKAAPLAVQLNVPPWLAQKLEASLGEDYAQEMEFANTRAATDVRVNTIKTSVETVLQSLQSVGYKAFKTDLSPWCIRFEQRIALSGLELYRQGHFDIQDEGSQLLALVSGAKTGEKVVDFCAGAGGKSLALAAMMNNKGTLYACDVHDKRLEQLNLRAKRAGVHNIRTHVLSSEHDKWVKKHRHFFDLVLIDAPCSGTGTWRRNPDSRWNLKPEHLNNLVILQQSILQSASRLVKPGGRLLYATCSLLEEENQMQVTEFLSNNTDFEYSELSMSETLKQKLHDNSAERHELQLSSFKNNTDGFFVCALERKKAKA